MILAVPNLTGTDDPDTGDIYAGLDRFGRISNCRWHNNSTDEDAVDLKYGYDRDSNRLWRQDDIARSQSKNFDELYTYDGLQRLKTMQRGLLDSGHTSISNQTYSQCWNLDATENWTGMKQADAGSTWTLEQSRTANTVNEITDITNSVGSAWAQPAYDPAGNMTTIPQSADPENSLTATWDAWNRLVKLVDTSTGNTIAEYQYDAQNRRITKKLYTSGTLDQTRHIYLSKSNQVLEERVDSSTSPALQNIWGLIYIDGLILRDRDTTGSGTLDERRYCLQDANWNTVALTDETGTITQRFCYEPFGTCQFLEADYEAGTNDSEWTTLFTGRELDPESGLYYFRARYWHSDLGLFICRDLFDYVDGESLYAGYFVPKGVDPNGHSLLGSFLGGVVQGALATVVVAAIATSAVAVGVPLAVVTIGLSVVAVTGAASLVADSIADPSAENLAENLGILVGSGLTGRALARPVASRLSPRGNQPPPGGINLGHEVAQGFHVRPGGGSIPAQIVTVMGQGPTLGGAAGALTAAGGITKGPDACKALQ